MYKDIFLEALHSKRLLIVSFNSFEKGEIIRKCIPFDFGPSRRSKDKTDKYHFYDLDSPKGKHILSISERQVVKMEITNEIFEPAQYVNWTPNWFVARDWGEFS